MNTNQNRSRSIFCVSAAYFARADVLEASFPLIVHMYVGYFLSRLRFHGCFSSTTLLWQHPLTFIVMGYADNFEVAPGAGWRGL